MSQINKVRRLLSLIDYLQSGRMFTTKDLAEFLGVSRRTIFRDIKELQESGVAVCYDSSKSGYWIPGSSDIPPTDLAFNEVVALMVLSKISGSNSRRIPFLKDVDSAISKLHKNLPIHLASFVASLVDSVHIDAEQSRISVDKQIHYDKMIVALTSQVKIRLEYDDTSQVGSSKTLLAPYSMLFRRRGWYVVGRSSVHRAIRTFSLGRISQSELTDDAFTSPPRFNIQRHFKGAWNLIPESKGTSKISLRFSPYLSHSIAELNWNDSQQITWNQDGTLDLVIQVSGLREVSWWIASFADQVTVLGPPELVELMKCRIKRAATNYNLVVGTAGN